MTITLELTPEMERGLLLQAEAKGVSLHDFVEEIVAEQARQKQSAAPPSMTLVEFFRASPLVGLDLKLERDQDLGRDITL